MTLVWALIAVRLTRWDPQATSRFVLLSVPLSFLIGAGFDVIVALWIAMAFERIYHGKLASLAVAAGIVTKWVPVVVVPLLLRTTSRAKGSVLLITSFGLLVAIGLPFALAKTSSSGQDPLSFHSGRSIQAESAIGSAIVIKRILVDDEYPVTYGHGSREVAATGRIPSLVSLALLAFVLAVVWLRGPPASASTWAAALVAIPALGPVASPQFLLWSLPLVVLTRFRIRLAFFAASALSMSMFTGPFYPAEGTALAVLTLARNAFLVATLALLVAECTRRPSRSPRKVPTPA
jgi:uncharacterized membrane protein